jgi:hypothetical protein
MHVAFKREHNYMLHSQGKGQACVCDMKLPLCSANPGVAVAGVPGHLTIHIKAGQCFGAVYRYHTCSLLSILCQFCCLHLLVHCCCC